MVEKVVKLLVRNGEIVQEEIEIYQYGLELLTKKLLHVFVILFIGFIGDEFFEVLVFLMAYASIREYAGGYHAKTEIGCYCCTGVVTLSTLFFLQKFQTLRIGWIWLMLVACGIVIWLFSPQEALNKPLSVREKLVYRKKAHFYLFLEGLLCLSGFFLETVLYGITCAWTIQTVMFFTGWFSKKR
ncbi:MAG: accessory gene regulator B family protein [Lachnospiraceae bacterium]|nr:accessory gene regulator B family protein [Lachnospiraceae bacterium]